MPVRAGGTIVTVPVTAVVPTPAVRVTVSDFVTELVVIWNVAVIAPLGMVTEAGTTASALLLESVTTSPVPVAGRFKVTVPVADTPPATVDGATVSACGVSD